jgi:accessory colonization factor AcfC
LQAVGRARFGMYIPNIVIIDGDNLPENIKKIKDTKSKQIKLVLNDDVGGGDLKLS